MKHTWRVYEVYNLNVTSKKEWKSDKGVER